MRGFFKTIKLRANRPAQGQPSQSTPRFWAHSAKAAHHTTTFLKKVVGRGFKFPKMK